MFEWLRGVWHSIVGKPESEEEKRIRQSGSVARKRADAVVAEMKEAGDQLKADADRVRQAAKDRETPRG